MRSYILCALIAIFLHIADGNDSSAAAPFPTPYLTAGVSPVLTPASVNPNQEAAYAARELVNASIWGMVSSLAYDRENAPFGNVLSYSDGGTGTPYFHLTTLDGVTVNHSAVDPRSSLTVSQYALGTCRDLDPQEPPCVKVTLSGKLVKVEPRSREAVFANATLYNRHPRFEYLPAGTMFEMYKLNVTNVFVINSYNGSPKYPSVEDYFNVKL